jgi:hypothetical protein
MATIKTQNGKVILKNGKVSCECCGEICDGEFETTDQNVFQISKEQYNAYASGGIWHVSTTWTQIESADPFEDSTITVSGTGSGSVSLFQEGCIHNVSGIAISNITFSEDEESYVVQSEFGFGISLSLKIDNSTDNTKYYAKYIGFSNVSSSELTESPTGYPPNVNFNIDGNNLIAFGDWYPGFSSFNNYTNNSTATLNATFSQS